MLKAAAPTIKALQALAAISAQNLNVPSARELFRSRSNVPYTNEQIDAFLEMANNSRRRSRSGWLPPDVDRISVEQPTAQEQMLIDQRNFAVLEAARITGTPAHWLSVPIADRTYSNITAERRQFLDLVAMPYLKAVSDRLSLGDCCPSTQRVKWQFGGFLQADTKERYEAHEIALRAGFKTVNEVRKLEDLPPIAGGDVLPTLAVRNA